MTRKRSRSPSQDADPTCPICLCDIQAVKDRALVAGCMHVFCLPCLQRWVTYKRFCPLCKGPIRSYLYDIRSDDSYNECVLPDIARSGAPGRHSRWETPDSSYQQHQSSGTAAPRGAAASATAAPRVALRSEAWYTWGPAEGAGSSRRWRRDDRHQQQQRQQQQGRRRSGPTTTTSGSSSEGEAEDGQQPGAVQPRPYYWRLQQRMLASSEPALAGPPAASTRSFAMGAVANGAAATATAAGAARPPPPRGHMRQQVYDLGLWAQPPAPNPAAGGTTAGTSRSSSSSRGGQQPPTASGMVGRVSQRAAEAWVDRDLQVLLQEEDVMIVRAYVMGLVHSFGLRATAAGNQAAASQQQVMVAAAQAAAAQATRQQQQQQQVPPETLTGPVASLQGFLFDKAAHFWHELCSFAGAGYTQDTYDRLVKYSWPANTEAAGAPPPPPAAAAAAVGAPSRSSSPVPARRATGGAASVRDAAAGSAPPPAGIARLVMQDVAPHAAAVHAAAGALASAARAVFSESPAGGDSTQQPVVPTPNGQHHQQQKHGSSSGGRSQRGRSWPGSPGCVDPGNVQQAAPAAVQLQPEVQEQEPPAAEAHRRRHKSSRKDSRRHRRERSRHRSSSRRRSQRRSSRRPSHSSREGGEGDRSRKNQAADRPCRTTQEEDRQRDDARPRGNSSPAEGSAGRRWQAAGHAAASAEQQAVASGSRHATLGSEQDPHHPQPSAEVAAREPGSEEATETPAMARPSVGHREQGTRPQQLPLEQRVGLLRAAGACTPGDGVAAGGEGLQHRKNSSRQVMPQVAQRGQPHGQQHGPDGASAASASVVARRPAAMTRAAMLARVAELKASLNARRLGATAPAPDAGSR